MKSKTSKAQLEVWEWKEKAYEQLKNIPSGKQIAFIKKQTADLVAQLKEYRNKFPRPQSK
jgi:hypothetical protein